MHLLWHVRQRHKLLLSQIPETILATRSIMLEEGTGKKLLRTSTMSGWIVATGN